MSKATLALLFVLLLQACPDSNKPTPQPPTVPNQRFVPIGPPTGVVVGVPWHGHFALDTKTGQLCRTWDWELKDAKGKPQEPWSELPTCMYLFSRYPDSPSGIVRLEDLPK